MEADGFMYDAVHFNHESNLIDDFDMLEKNHQTPKSNHITPRKFGTDITRSVIGNSSKRRSSNSGNLKKIVDLANNGNKNQSQEQRDQIKFLSPTRGITSRFHPSRTPPNFITTNKSSLDTKLVNQTPLDASHPINSGRLSSSGRKVLVRKSTRKTKPNSTAKDDKDVIRNDQDDHASFNHVTQTPSTTRKSVEYTIHFNAGPIGLKLEPIVKNDGRELGCRVMRFVESSRTSPTGRTSQAKKSGKINIGDVLVMIDDTNIMSRSYSEIVEILKASASSVNGRSITFRSVRDTGSPKSSSKQFLIDTTNKQSSLSPEESVNNLITMTSTHGSTSISVNQPKYSLSGSKTLKPNNVSPIFENQLLTPTSKRENESVQTPKENLRRIFSPSNVRKISQSSNVKSESSQLLTPQQQVEETHFVNFLQSVMKSVAPTAVESLRNTSSTVTNAVTKFSEVVTGTVSNEFSEAMQLKMVLLQELSEAKAALGESEDVKKTLELEIENLNSKNRQAENDKADAEIALKTEKDKCATVEMNMKEREAKLKSDSIRQAEDLCRAQQKVAESMATAERLFEENEVLKARMEEATIDFEAREDKFKNQLRRDKLELENRDKRLQGIQTQMMHLENQLEDRDNKVLTVSHELMERTMKLDRLMSIVQEKDSFFQQKDDSLKEAQKKISHLQEANNALQKKNEEEVLKNVENDTLIRRLTRDMENKVEEANNVNLIIQKKDEELKKIQNNHENIASKLVDEKEKLNEQMILLKDELSLSNENFGIIKCKLEEVTKSESKLMKENATLKEKIDQCNIRTQESYDNVETYKSKLSETQNKIDFLLTEKKSFEEEIRKLNDERSAEHTRSESTRKQWQEQKSELETKLEDALSTLQAKCEMITEREILFKNKLHLINESFAEKEKSSIYDLEKQSSEVMKLKCELESLQAENENLRVYQLKKESSLSSDIEELTQQLDGKSKENERITKDLSSTTLENSELRNNLQTVVLSKNELEETLSKVRIDVADETALKEKEIAKIKSELDTHKEKGYLILKERDNFESIAKRTEKDLIEEKVKSAQILVTAAENETRLSADIERLNGSIESLTQEKNDLSQNIGILTEKTNLIVRLEAEKEQLSKDLSESMVKFEDVKHDLKTQIQNLEKQNMVLNEDWKQSSTEIDIQEQNIEKLRNELDYCKSQLSDLKTDKKLSDELAEKMSIREDAAISNIKTLSKSLESMTEQLEQTNHEKIELENQLRNISAEVSMLKDLNVGLEEKIKSIETIHAQDIKRANDLKESGFQMKEAFEKESEILKSELNKCQKLIREEVQSSQEIIQRKDDTIQNLKTSAEDLEKQVVENLIAFNKLEADLKAKVTTESNLLTKIQEKDSDLIALSDRINDLEKELSSMSSASIQLKKILEENKDEMKLMNSCCDEKDKFVTNMSEKLSVANIKIISLQKEVADLLESKDADVKSLNALIKASEETFSKENKSIEKEREAMSEKIKDTLLSMKEKQFQIAKLEESSRKREEVIQSLSSEKENEVKKMQKKLEGMEQEIVDSERRVYEVLSMLDDRERTIEVLEREIEANLEQFHSHFDNEGKCIYSCNDQVEDLKEEIALTQKSRDGALIEIERLTGELLGTQLKCENETIRSTNLETSLKEVQTKLQRTASILEELNKESKTFKQHILDLGDLFDLDFSDQNNSLELQNIPTICEKIEIRMKEYQSNAKKALQLAANRQNAIARLERMLSAKEKEFEDTKKQSNNKLKRVSELMLVSEQERTKTCEMEIKCEVLNVTNNENKSKLADYQKCIQQLQTEKSILQSQLTEYEEREHFFHEQLDITKCHLLETQNEKEGDQLKIKELELKCILLKEAADNSYENADTYRKLTLDQKDKLKTIASDLEEIKERNCQLETQISDLCRSESGLIQKYECESLNVANLGKEIEGKNKIIESLESRIKSLRENVDLYDNEKLDIQTRLDIFQAETRDEVQGLKNIAENRSYVINSLKNEVIKKSSELNSLKNTFSDKCTLYNHQIEENQQLIKTNENLENQISDLHKSSSEEIEPLRKEVAAKTLALQKLESINNKIIKENLNLKNEINKDRKDIENILQDSSKKKDQLQAAEEKNKEHLDKIDDLETTLKEKCEVICQQKSKIRDMTTRITQNNEAQSTLKTKLNNFEDIIRETESAASEAINLVEVKEKEIFELTRELEKKVKDLNFSEALNIEKKNLLCEYEKDYSRLESTLRNKNKEINSLLEKTYSLESNMESVEEKYHAECKKFEQERMELSNTSKSAQKGYEEAKIKIANAQKLVTERDGEILHLREASTKHEIEMVKLKSQLLEFETTSTDLQAVIESSEKNKAKYMSTIAKLEKETLRLNDDLLQSDESNSKLTEIINELELRIEQIQSKNLEKVTTNSSHISILKAENQVLQGKIEDLLKQIHHSEKNMEEVESKNLKLLSEYDDKAAEITTLSRKMSECREEAEKKRFQHDQLMQRYNEQEQLIRKLREKENTLIEKTTHLDSIKEKILKFHVNDNSFEERFDFKSTPIEDIVEKLLNICRKKIGVDNILAKSNETSFSPRNNCTDLESYSPTLAIVSKHSLLLEELQIMKAAISTAITPVKICSTESDKKSNCTDEEYLDELKEKNKILLSLEERIDALVTELTVTKENLNFKEGCLEDLTLSLKDFENERTEINSKVDSMAKYIDQMEDSLTNEIKRRRRLEKDHKMLRSEAKALAAQYKLKASELIEIRKELDFKKNQCRSTILPEHTKQELKNAATRLLFQSLEARQRNKVSNVFHHWVCVTSQSQAVSRQMDLTQQMASQLESTRENLFALKSRLRNRGLLTIRDDSSSDANQSSQDTQKAHGLPFPSLNNSSFWDFSDEENTVEIHSSSE